MPSKKSTVEDTLKSIPEDVTVNLKKQRVPGSVESAVNAVLVDSGSLRTSMINFLLIYNLRFGVALLGRMVTLARTKPKTLFDLGEVLSEKHLHFREEAVRMGLFAASFTGSYVALKSFLSGGYLKALMKKVIDFGPETDDDKGEKWWHSFVSGFGAGSTLVFMDKSWHRTLALYMATRASQCFYNFSKARGYFHFWGSSWAHGDSLLFGLSSAQIMYSYVMRPNALPPPYYSFIRKQGPLPEVVLQAVRDNCRDKPVNVAALFDFVKENGGQQALDIVKQSFPNNTPFPRAIPSRAMHPYTPYGSVHTAFAFWNVAKQIFGVYLSLALVPKIVLSFTKFIKNPGSVVFKSVLSALQSTLFLACFCSWYSGFITGQRHLIDFFNWRDSKLWYYLAGVFSSFSILIERKDRRSELALYAFPRAADAFYTVLYERQLVVSLPQGELLLFCASMGCIMFFHENDRKTLSPYFARFLERFLPDNVLHPEKKLTKSASTFEFGELRSDTPPVYGPFVTPAPGSPSSKDQMISMGGSSLV